MNLPSFSVKRPIFTIMVTLIVVILGAVSLSRLQIDMLPNIELPTLSIRTDYEGASPEVMERLVTQIIEEIVVSVQKREQTQQEVPLAVAAFDGDYLRRINLGLPQETGRKVAIVGDASIRWIRYFDIECSTFMTSWSPSSSARGWTGRL